MTDLDKLDIIADSHYRKKSPVITTGLFNVILLRRLNAEFPAEKHADQTASQ